MCSGSVPCEFVAIANAGQLPLYDVPASEKAVLDSYEGLGYGSEDLKLVVTNRRQLPVQTYPCSRDLYRGSQRGDVAGVTLQNRYYRLMVVAFGE